MFSIFPFVHSYVRLFVSLFVFLSQGQRFCVKIYKISYFEDPLMDFIHIWHGWISFIFGMMVDIGLKFLSAPSLPRG